ncbi:hypothetical protein QO010_000041 [Caulobacter ginsengisoli]|uniref:Uncharacterized protein n=1 Tax=Caulobacter ginsengisoli TaxID=400775 RepID=A0ABU0IJV9_9CAUL|nr:hypothetical protein [Caulobacter ginsengisoli]MDQ0462293.1 hypothetical protein [Caulobacter ginsengisoli]
MGAGKPWTQLALMAAALFVGAPAATARDNAKPPFEVTLPPGVTTLVSQGPDFTVYYFRKGEVTYAGAYVGNFPMFTPDPDGGPVQQKVECSGSVVARREVLLVLKYKQGNAYVHAWTVGGPQANRITGLAILRSLRMPGQNEGLGSVPLKTCS